MLQASESNDKQCPTTDLLSTSYAIVDHSVDLSISDFKKGAMKN